MSKEHTDLKFNRREFQSFGRQPETHGHILFQVSIEGQPANRSDDLKEKAAEKVWEPLCYGKAVAEL